MVSCHFLIPAAGRGKRMGLDHNKLLIELQGKTLLERTLQVAERAKGVAWIGVIGHDRDRSVIMPMLDRLTKPHQWILGGETRQESVFNGLQALPPEAKYVLIHDGARCLISADLIDRCAQALAYYPALICAVPVKDTIKLVYSEIIIDTPDRSKLWIAQTPQGFVVNKILNAHRWALNQGWNVTDDSALLEKLGIPVTVIMGEETNIKITTPQDLIWAEAILNSQKEL